MDQNNESQGPATDDESADQLSVLKERAKKLGIKHSPNIGVDALRARVNKALTGEGDDDDAGSDEDDAASENEKPARNLTKAERDAQLRKEIQSKQMALQRVRITQMNPTKKDLQGEIFTVASSYLGIVKRFVPYGEATEEGWHVPLCILNQMKQRKFLQIKTRKDPQKPGHTIVDTKWVKEFAIELLDPLTPEELAQLRAQQAAALGL